MLDNSDSYETMPATLFRFAAVVQDSASEMNMIDNEEKHSSLCLSTSYYMLQCTMHVLYFPYEGMVQPIATQIQCLF